MSRVRAPGTESNDPRGAECLRDARSGDGVLDVGALLCAGERGPSGACGGGASDCIEPCVAIGGAWWCFAVGVATGEGMGGRGCVCECVGCAAGEAVVMTKEGAEDREGDEGDGLRDDEPA